MENVNKYIFISYARVDSERVIPILDDLKKSGFHIWYDKEICVGTEWPDYIETQIRNCSCLIVFISNSAVNSVNVRNEINFAITQNKDIVVFFLEDTPLKYGLGLQIGNKQSILAYKHNDYESMMKEFISADVLQQCRGETRGESIFFNGFVPSIKSDINAILDSFQTALLKLKGNASLNVLATVYSEEEKLKELFNKVSESKRSQYFMHLAKIDLFLNALKMQFSFLTTQTLSCELMFIDTYLSQILPEIECMRQL